MIKAEFKILLFFFLIVPIGFFSCKEKSTGSIDAEQQPVATVKNKTLYRADVDAVIPVGATGEDSIAIAQEFIKMWISNELMYDKAKQNITNRAEIDELIENYKRSLIVNTYQEQLLREHLSKNIPENDLKAYFDQNPDKFNLDESIIKGLYLKVPANSPQLKNFQKWYTQPTDAAVENIEKNTLQNAVGYEYFYDKWIPLDDVMDNIPTVISDNEQFLRTNKNFQMQDSSFVYLLNIKEYKLKGTPAPYDYVKDRLKDIFLEWKKVEYLDQIRKDLYDKAVSDDEIKLYNK